MVFEEMQTKIISLQNMCDHEYENKIEFKAIR